MRDLAWRSSEEIVAFEASAGMCESRTMFKTRYAVAVKRREQSSDITKVAKSVRSFGDKGARYPVQ